MKTKELLVLKSQAISTNMASSTKISVAPSDPTDVVKNIAPLLLRRNLTSIHAALALIKKPFNEILGITL